MHKYDAYSFRRGCRGERPTQDSPPPPLGQKPASFAHQLIDVNVVKGHDQQDHQCDAKGGGAIYTVPMSGRTANAAMSAASSALCRCGAK